MPNRRKATGLDKINLMSKKILRNFVAKIQ